MASVVEQKGLPALLEGANDATQTSLRRRAPDKLSPWELLKAEFPCRPINADETYYALPALLLRAVGDMLSSEDLLFEVRLRQLAVTGFWRTFPFYSAALDSEWLTHAEFDRRSIRTTWREISRESGEVFGNTIDERIHDEFGIDRFSPQVVRDSTWETLKGYVGWLVTNTAFQSELSKLLARSRHLLTPDRSCYDRWSGRGTANSLPGQTTSQGDGRSEQLCKRWGLKSILAWELPEPQEAHVSMDGSAGGGGAGVHVFIPWPLMRSGEVDISQLALDVEVPPNLSHLSDWATGDGFGPGRYSKLLDVHIYRDLTLLRRYPEAFHRRKGELNRRICKDWVHKSSGKEPNEGDGKDSAKIDREYFTFRQIEAHLKRRLAAEDALTRSPRRPRKTAGRKARRRTDSR